MELRGTYNQNGITIPFPLRTLRLDDESLAFFNASKRGLIPNKSSRILILNLKPGKIPVFFLFQEPSYKKHIYITFMC